MLKTILIILLLVCAYTDLKKRKIYNAVLWPAVLLGFFYALWQHGLAGYRDSLFGLLLGGGLLFLPYYLGGMGAGDVKLLAAVGALGGVNFVWQVFLTAALVGGMMAVVTALKKGILPLVFFRAVNPRLAGNFREQTVSTSIPYGLAIAAGGLLVLLMG